MAAFEFKIHRPGSGVTEYRTDDGKWRLVREGDYTEGVLWALERFDGVQPYPWHYAAHTWEFQTFTYAWRYLATARREAPRIVAEILADEAGKVN